ncbi:MAG: hypothetical protein ACPHJ1_09570, partial [Ilumatobacteraceae bacterium]
MPRPLGVSDRLIDVGATRCGTGHRSVAVRAHDHDPAGFDGRTIDQNGLVFIEASVDRIPCTLIADSMAAALL